MQRGFEFFTRFDFAVRKLREPHHMHAEQHANLIERIARRNLAGEQFDRLAHFERVADREPQRLVHIGDDRNAFASDEFADRNHQMRELFRFVNRLHERACAGLDVEHNRVRACCQLLGHDAGCDQRDAADSCGDVAQGVHFLVRRNEVARLSDDRDADLVYDLLEPLHRLFDAHARDRFELIERSARMSEPSAAHFGNRPAACRDKRRNDERRGVAYAAGGMLVDLYAAQIGKIDHVAGVHHCHRQLRGFAVGHAVEYHRHLERRHLIIRDGAVRESVHDKPDLVSR